jgi:hypothetical protein
VPGCQRKMDCPLGSWVAWEKFQAYSERGNLFQRWWN